MATGDWAERQVCLQVGALEERIEIGVLAGGRMARRRGSLEEVLYLVPWLVWRNRQGAHVYVRPLASEGSAGVILVDDLDAAAIREMGADGMGPVAVVETSTGNHQAWVRVAAGPIGVEVATAAARLLARRYGGDMNSAVANHLGRLAGFTNPKEKYKNQEGRYPWVRVRAAGQGVASAAEALLAEAEGEAVALRRGLVRIERLELPQAGEAVSALGVVFRKEVMRLRGRFGAGDMSRLEWTIVLDLARRFPEVSAAELGRALYEAGELTGLAARKCGHMADYIERTVARARARAAGERAAWGGSRTAETTHIDRRGMRE